MATKTIHFCDNCKLETDRLISISITYQRKQDKAAKEAVDFDEMVKALTTPVYPFKGTALEMFSTKGNTEKKRIEICELCFKEIPILRRLKIKE